MKIDSSNIAEAEYDPNEKLLQITFHSGPTYNYYDVDIRTVSSFLSAKSKGKFFADNIKNKFRYNNIDKSHNL